MGKWWNGCDVGGRKKVIETLSLLFKGRTLYRGGDLAEEMTLSHTTPTETCLRLVGQPKGLGYTLVLSACQWPYIPPEDIYHYVGYFLNVP